MFYFAFHGKGKHLIMSIWTVDEMQFESVSLLFANAPFLIDYVSLQEEGLGNQMIL